jgi:hypothetical protein
MKAAQRLAHGLATEGSRFDSWQGKENSLFYKASRPAVGPDQPPSDRVPGENLVGREVRHSPATSAGS